MKKYYLVVDDIGVDVWIEKHNSLEKAIKAAENEWNALTDYDKNRRNTYYILETEDPDGLDGDVIKAYK